MLQILYGVAALFLIVKVLPSEEFGSYVLAQGLVQFITLVSGGMVHRFLIRELSKDNWEELIPFNSLLLSLFLSMVIIVPILLFNSSISALFNSPIFGEMLSLSIPLLLIAMQIKSFTQRIIISKREPIKLFAANGSYFITLTFGLLYLNIIGDLNSAIQVIFLSAFSAIISALVGWVLSIDIIRRMKIRFSFDQMKRIMEYGKYTMGGATANMMVNTADSYLISYLLGPVQVAYYNSAKFIYKFYQTIPQILDITFYPYASKLAQEGRNRDIRDLYEKLLCFIYLVLIPVNIIAIIFAERIMALLYSGRYEGAHVILQILIIAASFQPLSATSALVAFSFNKPSGVLYGNLITLLAVVGSGFYLVFQFGVEGMAMALAIGFIVQSFFMTMLIKQNIEVSFRGVLLRIGDMVNFIKRSEKA